MKYRWMMGMLLVVGLVSLGCDPNRGADVASKSGSSGSTDATKPASPRGGGVNDLSAYDDFVVEYPESYDGEFNPNGLEVGTKVGQLAPEIEGVDLDGVEFKLSDYRGKVVMLDFYGDW